MALNDDFNDNEDGDDFTPCANENCGSDVSAWDECGLCGKLFCGDACLTNHDCEARALDGSRKCLDCGAPLTDENTDHPADSYCSNC